MSLPMGAAPFPAQREVIRSGHVDVYALYLQWEGRWIHLRFCVDADAPPPTERIWHVLHEDLLRHFLK